MSHKIVQTVAPLTSVGAASVQSSAISPQSGFIRIVPVGAAVAVAIGTDPVATTSDYVVSQYQPEILKERVARQQISGITTGATTVVTFGENYGNPFVVGDYVTVSGATTVGINTTHVAIARVSDSSITINHNSSSVSGIVTVTGAVVARSVKVAAYGIGGTATTVSITEVQTTSQS
jgi:hypothetical protein